ncbi:MAG: chromosome segregation protein SMC, partial [Planctomycetaceae bacterium]
RKISEFDEQIAQAVRQRDRQAGLVRETLLAVEAAQERLQRLHDQRQTLQSQHDQARRTLADLRERRSAGLARRSVLDDLEQRQEGLSIGVREILHRAETSPYPPWNEIIGSVADLLEVDLENAALLEVALGHRAQLIVLKAYEPLMEYLRQGQCRIEGQVGFLAHFFVAPPDGERARDGEGASPQAAESPLTTHHSPLRTPHSALRTSSNLCDRPGVLGRADRLVRASRKIPRLAEHLLADTWIVETLDVALALSAGDGRGCRFVTLQGELLEAEGTLFVGTIKSETALLSRKSELRRLKSDLTTLDEEIAEQERRLAEMHDSLHASRSERSSAESESARNADRLTAEKSRFAALEDNLSRLARDRESVQAERAGGAARSARLAEEQSAFQSARAETEAELAALEEAMQQAETALTELTAALQSLDQEQTTARMQLAKQEERLTGLETELDRLDAEERTRFAQRDEVERRCAAVHAKRREALLQILNTGALLSEAALVQESLSELLERLLADKDELRLARGKNQAEQARLGKQLRGLEEKRHAADMQARDLSTQLAALAERIAEEFQAALPEVVASGASAYGASPQTASFEEVRPELEARVSRLRKKLKLMGSVNTDSLRGLDELEERFAYLSAQRQDLVEAKAALEDIIRRINHESKRLFVETFERIRSHFQHLFRQAFGGGDGDIVLEDPNDVLECGIDIVARPPGKELKSISLMSGGEKTLTAFALLLALFRSRPSPYCVLDEVDAALDEANVGRLTALLGEFRATTQFVIITHKKPTMTICDLLYGVTMEQSGISKRVSVRFEDVGEQGDIQAAPERRAAA